MQKWEYYTVKFMIFADKGKTYLTQANDQDLGTGPFSSSYPELDAYLNNLGDQGWELVGRNAGIYHFKRPKP